MLARTKWVPDFPGATLSCRFELELVLKDWECVMPRDQEDSTSGFAAVQKCECGHLRLAHELENGCRVADCGCEAFTLAGDRPENR